MEHICTGFPTDVFNKIQLNCISNPAKSIKNPAKIIKNPAKIV